MYGMVISKTDTEIQTNAVMRRVFVDTCFLNIHPQQGLCYEQHKRLLTIKKTVRKTEMLRLNATIAFLACTI